MKKRLFFGVFLALCTLLSLCGCEGEPLHVSGVLPQPLDGMWRVGADGLLVSGSGNETLIAATYGNGKVYALTPYDTTFTLGSDVLWAESAPPVSFPVRYFIANDTVFALSRKKPAELGYTVVYYGIPGDPTAVILRCELVDAPLLYTIETHTYRPLYDAACTLLRVRQDGRYALLSTGTQAILADLEQGTATEIPAFSEDGHHELTTGDFVGDKELLLRTREDGETRYFLYHISSGLLEPYTPDPHIEEQVSDITGSGSAYAVDRDGVLYSYPFPQYSRYELRANTAKTYAAGYYVPVPNTEEPLTPKAEQYVVLDLQNKREFPLVPHLQYADEVAWDSLYLHWADNRTLLVLYCAAGEEGQDLQCKAEVISLEDIVE